MRLNVFTWPKKVHRSRCGVHNDRHNIAYYFTYCRVWYPPNFVRNTRKKKKKHVNFHWALSNLQSIRKPDGPVLRSAFLRCYVINYQRKQTRAVCDNYKKNNSIVTLHITAVFRCKTICVLSQISVSFYLQYGVTG